MRKVRLYMLAVLTAAALLGGCSASAPATDTGKTAEESAETAAEETTAEEEATAEESAAEETKEETGTAEENTEEETVETTEGEADPSQTAESGEGGEVAPDVISPEIAEGHVIAPEANDGQLSEIVNVNFELVTRDDMDHAVITGVNGKDEVVWQNVTEEYETSEVPSLTGLMILADSYFYVEDGNVVRLNKETGEEYWRNTELKDRVADKAWAQEGETFYFAGADKADLFVMSMHGQTIKRVKSFNGLFEEPYRLRLKDGRILINYAKTPTGKPALISVDPEDYTGVIMVDTEEVPEITDQTIYASNTRTTLALRTGPGPDYESFDSVESGTEMYVLKVVGDYAYVYVKETGQVAYCTGQYVLIDDGSYRNAIEVAEEQGTVQAVEETPEETEETETPENTEEASAETTEEGDGKTYYVDVASSLYLRKEPDYSSDYVANLEPLTELTLLGYEDELAHVRVNATGEEGYVSPRYITDDLTNLRYAER